MRRLLALLLASCAASSLSAALPALAAPGRIPPRLPLMFEANGGQADARTRYVGRSDGMTLLLADGAVTAVIASGREAATLQMRLLGASPRARLHPASEVAARTSYFTGRNPGAWRTNLRTYTRVRYVDAYPGIDLLLYGRGRQLEFDFEVAPGAAPDEIAIAFDGIADLSIDASGALVLRTSGDDVRLEAPLAYQRTANARQVVPSRWRIVGPRAAAFEVGRLDDSRTLVIDPVLAHATRFGGALPDGAHHPNPSSDLNLFGDMATLRDGSVIVAGTTWSLDFPVLNRVHGSYGQPTPNAFVARLDPNGVLVSSAILGGTGRERVHAITTDGEGNVYLTGQTGSSDFPVTPGAYRTERLGPAGNDGEMWVAKLDSSLGILKFATYIGSASPNDIEVDPQGIVYVAGRYPSRDAFPTTFGALITHLARTPGFLTLIAPGGNTLRYSTGFPLEVTALALGRDGLIYCAGSATEGFAPAEDAYKRSPESVDAWFGRFNLDANRIDAFTWVGGSGGEYVTDLLVRESSPAGAFLLGATASSDFPVTAGAFSRALQGEADGFAARVDLRGTRLLASTYLGWNDLDAIVDGALDDTGALYVVGGTTSTRVGPAIFGGGVHPDGDLFVASLTPAAALSWVVILGSREPVVAGLIGVDERRNVYVVGHTGNGIQRNPRGLQIGPRAPRYPVREDVFVLKLLPSDALASLTVLRDAVTGTPATALGGRTAGRRLRRLVARRIIPLIEQRRSCMRNLQRCLDAAAAALGSIGSLLDRGISDGRIAEADGRRLIALVQTSAGAVTAMTGSRAR